MLPVRVLVIPALKTARPIFYSSLQHAYSGRRPFSSTLATRASEPPETFVTAFRNTSLFRKLADKPEALEALQNFAKLLQDAGVDLTSRKQPSTLQMIKLAANSEFREGAQRVAEEMQKAGIDLKSKEVMEEIMNLKSKLPGGGS
ncbi:hypothetical protein AX16_000201 [Volvariella volvacea WC 439]|nr:hypothetical protein AX16_000201 [Volvariella volvacea WC 439]